MNKLLTWQKFIRAVFSMLYRTILQAKPPPSWGAHLCPFGKFIPGGLVDDLHPLIRTLTRVSSSPQGLLYVVCLNCTWSRGGTRIYKPGNTWRELHLCHYRETFLQFERLFRAAFGKGAPAVLSGTPHLCSVRKSHELIGSPEWTLVKSYLHSSLGL